MNLKEVSELFKAKAQKYHREIGATQKDIILYESIIEDLEKKRISLAAQKLLYEKYRLKLTKGNLKIMLGTLKTDLFVLREKLKIVQEKYKMCRYVVNSLSYKQIALPFLVNFINEELKKNGISEVELIKINEKIKIHNANVKHNERNALLGADLHLIIDMLNQGYEEIMPLENKNADKLDSIVAKLNDVVDSDDLASIKDNFNFKEMYGNVYDNNDFKYIYTEILRHIQNKIYELIELLKHEEYYFDIETLKIIKTEYKDFYHKYMFIREKIDSLDKDNEISIENDLIVENPLDAAYDNNIGIKCNLYYASNSDDPAKCFLMRDLSSIREESLARIWQLLQDFKNGENRNLKVLENGYLEIKDYQIRIILKSLNNGNYSVAGVFIKKSNNLHNTYQNMFNRPLADINDEYAQAVEEQVAKYVAENGRKGTR